MPALIDDRKAIFGSFTFMTHWVMEPDGDLSVSAICGNEVIAKGKTLKRLVNTEKRRQVTTL